MGLRRIGAAVAAWWCAAGHYAEMLAPPPRLTSALRGHYDADQAYPLRKSALQSLKLPRPRDDWELARKIVPDWDDGKRLQNPRCCVRLLLCPSALERLLLILVW